MRDDPWTNGQFTLVDYFAVLLRRVVWIIVPILVFCGVGSAYAVLGPGQEKSYRATVLLEPAAEATGSGSSREVEADFMTSESVLTEANSRLQGGPHDWVVSVEEVEARLPGSSELVELLVTRPEAAEAETIARSVAEAYVAERTDAINEDIDERAERIGEEIESAEQALRELVKGQGGETPDPASEALVSVYQSQLSRLMIDQSTLRIDTPSTGAVVGTLPTVPVNSGFPAPALVTASLALGGLVGVILVFVVEGVDPKVRSRRDLARLQNREVLGVIPSSKRKIDGNSPPASLVTSLLGIRVLLDHSSSSAVTLAPVGRYRVHQVAQNLALAAESVGKSAVVIDIGSRTLTEDLGSARGERLRLLVGRSPLVDPATLDAASVSGAIVLVIRIGETRRDELDAALELLDSYHDRAVRVLIERRGRGRAKKGRFRDTQDVKAMLPVVQEAEANGPLSAVERA